MLQQAGAQTGILAGGKKGWIVNTIGFGKQKQFLIVAILIVMISAILLGFRVKKLVLW